MAATPLRLGGMHLPRRWWASIHLCLGGSDGDGMPRLLRLWMRVECEGRFRLTNLGLQPFHPVLEIRVYR